MTDLDEKLKEAQNMQLKNEMTKQKKMIKNRLEMIKIFQILNKKFELWTK